MKRLIETRGPIFICYGSIYLMRSFYIGVGAWGVEIWSFTFQGFSSDLADIAKKISLGAAMPGHIRCHAGVD